MFELAWTFTKWIVTQIPGICIGMTLMAVYLMIKDKAPEWRRSVGNWLAGLWR